MPWGAWGKGIAIGLVALLTIEASAAERVTYNETALDCVPEGCFIVRHIPSPKLKPKIAPEDAYQDECGQNKCNAYKRDTDPKLGSSIMSTSGPDVGSGVQIAVVTNPENEQAEKPEEKNRWQDPNWVIAIFTIALTVANLMMWLASRHQGTIMSGQLSVARSTAETSLDTLKSYKLVERAWFVPVDMEFHKVVNEGTVAAIIGMVKWVNSGRIPASGVEMVSAIKVIGVDDNPDEIEFPEYSGTKTIVAPNGRVVTEPLQISVEQMQGIALKVLKGVVLTKAAYRDNILPESSPRYESNVVFEIKCFTAPHVLPDPDDRSLYVGVSPAGSRNIAT